MDIELQVADVGRLDMFKSDLEDARRRVEEMARLEESITRIVQRHLERQVRGSYWAVIGTFTRFKPR
jgi:hypothetical protein